MVNFNKDFLDIMEYFSEKKEVYNKDKGGFKTGKVKDSDVYCKKVIKAADFILNHEHEISPFLLKKFEGNLSSRIRKIEKNTHSIWGFFKYLFKPGLKNQLEQKMNYLTVLRDFVSNINHNPTVSNVKNVSSDAMLASPGVMLASPGIIDDDYAFIDTPPGAELVGGFDDALWKMDEDISYSAEEMVNASPGVLEDFFDGELIMIDEETPEIILFDEEIPDSPETTVIEEGTLSESSETIVFEDEEFPDSPKQTQKK